MLRFLEVGLIGAVCLAVLAFGGTAPSFFFATQVIVLSLGVLLLLAGQGSLVAPIHLPVAVPLLLIVLVLLQILPLPASAAPLFGRTLEDLAGRSHFTVSIAQYQTVSHLLLLVTYLTAFFLTLVVCQYRRAKKRLVFALLALGMFEALYSLIQSFTGWQQIFTYVKKYYLEDATGTYINRNHFAGLLEMILPFAVAFALLRAEVLLRNALGGMATISKIVSRNELLSVVVWLGSDPVISRFETLGQEYNLTGQNRISIWDDTLGLIRQHPFFGTGFGSFSVAYPSVQTAFLNLLVEHAHCDYLEVVSELGFPGGLLVFGSIFWILALTVRNYKNAQERFDKAASLGCIGSISAILIHGLADFNLYIPANALVFAVILALAWTNTHRRGALS